MRTTLLRTAALAASATLGLAALPAASLAQQAPPPPAAPHSVTFPTPVEKTLKNGLRVVVVERPGVPIVAAQFVVKSGAEVDPPQLAGLASMTANLLTKGTSKRTAPQIAEAVEALGGSISADAAWDASSVSVQVMSSKIEPALDVLADVVRNPSFSEEEIERLRAQTLDDLNLSFSQPSPIARAVASRVVFGDTAYGHAASGTPDSIPRIKREDIVKLHDAYYRPDNAMFVIGGDVKAADAFKLAEKLFGDWAKPGAPLPSPAQAKLADVKPRVVVIDMPEAGQAAVVLARPGINRSSADYYKGIVTNTVLGGGYSARLNQEIRIKRGLSYGAGSRLDVRRDVGPFLASTQTKNESGAVVAGLLMSELTRLGSEAVPPTELTPRQASLSGNFARGLETTAGIVQQTAVFALYGLPLNEANNYIASVQKVTAADVQKFASTALGPKDASIVIVGDASKFIDELRKQFPNVEVIPRAELDLDSSTLRKTSK